MADSRTAAACLSDLVAARTTRRTIVESLAGGQSVAADGASVTEADLDKINRTIRELEGEYDRLSNADGGLVMVPTLGGN